MILIEIGITRHKFLLGNHNVGADLSLLPSNICERIRKVIIFLC